MSIAEEGRFPRGDRFDDGFLPFQSVERGEFSEKVLERLATAVLDQRFEPMPDQIFLLVADDEAAEPMNQAAKLIESCAREFHAAS
jgi:hypothetical protein